MKNDFSTYYASHGAVIWGGYFNFPEQMNNGGESDFANSDKSRIFVPSKITKDYVNQIITGARPVTSGTAIQAASSYLRGSESAIPSDRGANLRGQDEERLREYISENNLWLPEPDPARKFGYGGEAQIYLYGDYVIKSNDAHFYDSWEGYFNSLLIHNLFFPTTSYELIGFYEYKDFDNRILYALVKQSYIKTPDKTNLLEVRKIMSDLGFIYSAGNHYHHPELGIEIKDLHTGNVLTKEKVLYFVDTIFYLKDKLAGGGETGEDNLKTVLFSELPRNYQIGIIIRAYEVNEDVEWSINEKVNWVKDEKKIDALISDYKKHYPKRKFAYGVLPMKFVIDKVMASEVGEDYDSWKEYHEEYGHSAKHTQALFPILIDEDNDEYIDDGWHRFHRYYDLGLKEIPVVKYL